LFIIAAADPPGSGRTRRGIIVHLHGWEDRESKREKGRGKRPKNTGDRIISLFCLFFFPLASFLCPLSSGLPAVAGTHRVLSSPPKSKAFS
jgi:hypothetical protein